MRKISRQNKVSFEQQSQHIRTDFQGDSDPKVWDKDIFTAFHSQRELSLTKMDEGREVQKSWAKVVNAVDTLYRSTVVFTETENHFHLGNLLIKLVA
jgi:hypothetical protein